MAQETPKRSTEIGLEQEAALAIAGAVALPSPFPATGRVSLVMVLGDRAGQKAAPARFFIKSVQVISERNIVTRIVGLEDLRAVGFFAEGEEPGACGEWTLLPIRRLSGRIEAATRSLTEVGAEPDGSYEFLLFQRAVLYVSEATAVLHRQEFGLTAAISAEAFVSFTCDCGGLGAFCCCRKMEGGNYGGPFCCCKKVEGGNYVEYCCCKK